MGRERTDELETRDEDEEGLDLEVIDLLWDVQLREELANELAVVLCGRTQSASIGTRRRGRGRTLLLVVVKQLDHAIREVKLDRLVRLDRVTLAEGGVRSAGALGRRKSRGGAYTAFWGSVQSMSCNPICSGVTIEALSSRSS